MTSLTCTVTVKGMTVCKQVHTKEVQKGIVKGAQRGKDVHMQVKKKKIKKQSYVYCAQIKVLGLRLILTHL